MLWMRSSRNSCCNTPFRPAWATTTFGTPERALKLTAEPARRANCTTFPAVADALGENNYALLSRYRHHSCLTSSSAACALTCTVSSASTAWTFAVSAFARGLPTLALRRCSNCCVSEFMFYFGEAIQRCAAFFLLPHSRSSQFS